MITDTLSKISIAAILTVGQLVSPLVPADKVLASHEMSLEKRYYPVQKENILLNMAYLNGNVKNGSEVKWDEILKPQHYSFRLNPGETFAFHDSILPGYDHIVKTTNAHFNSDEGFKTAGYMVGDGVCHLASLFYWAALDAGLKAEAPRNHNFMPIPGIDKKYGVSIYSNPLGSGDANQNLYITDNKDKAVEFNFDYDGDNLKVTITEEN